MQSSDIILASDVKFPSDTILIFAEPEAYFFPCYGGRVFAPLGAPRFSLRYLLYQVMYLLHLPCCSLFWGRWKSAARTAERVILFDYGYQRGMERYIRRINPGCQVFLFFWNRVNRYNRAHLRFSDAGAVFSTDTEDCKRYGLRYNHIFYPRELYASDPPGEPDKLFFLGVDKGRAPYIASLKAVLEESGLVCDIRVLSPSAASDYRERFRDILTDRRLSYGEYLNLLRNCGVLLDINQEGQSGLTMRVLESIYLSRKLITNNRHISDYDFYDPDNILVLPEDELPDAGQVRDFLQKPFRPYSDTILRSYSFEHWIAGFTK